MHSIDNLIEKMLDHLDVNEKERYTQHSRTNNKLDRIIELLGNNECKYIHGGCKKPDNDDVELYANGRVSGESINETRANSIEILKDREYIFADFKNKKIKIKF